jgi:hypothetical protein
MMRQGINTLEIDRMAAPQAQGIETLGSMEDAPMIPNGGIQAAVPEATEMLAAAGREGDIYIVHASEGDTVIPEEVLAGEGGAQIREMLFRQMEQLGVDPQRYVVGNELNSINPETGLPEFFFKKIFKSIKKFFKKVAPIVLPIALSITPLGPILGSAIGSGIGSLIQGGSAKDALKAAAFGGITAGIASGIGGVLQGSGSFGADFVGGVKAGFPTFGGLGGTPTIDRIFGPQEVSAASDPNVAARLAAAPGNVKSSPFQQASFSDTSNLAAVSPDALGPVQGPVKDLGATPWAQASGTTPVNQNIRLAQTTTPGTKVPRKFTLPDQLPTPKPMQEQLKDLTPLERIQQYSPFAVPETQLGAEYGDQWLLGPDATTYLKDLRVKKLYDAEVTYMSQFGKVPDSEKLSILRKAREVASNVTGPGSGSGEPGYLQQYGATAALLGGAGIPLGWYETPEQETPESTIGDPIDPKEVASRQIFRRGITRYPKREPVQPIGFEAWQTQFPITKLAAHGGEMQNFPPRIGAISGPGTGTSDDVPAMLSDGEFVMTAQAVRGAGNGSRRQGVKNLYDIMRNFEAVA